MRECNSVIVYHSCQYKYAKSLRQSKPILYVSLYVYPNIKIEFCEMTEISNSNLTGHKKNQP